MKNRSRTACLYAAVAALAFTAATAPARDLTFDDTTLTDDGSGTGALYSIWDTSSPYWLDGATSVTWSNSPADSAFFGNTTNTFVGATKINQIVISGTVAVQDLNLGIAPNGATYSIISDPDLGSVGPLTLLGNVTKAAGNGNPQLQLTTGLELAAGDHKFSTNDTPGDAAPEINVEAQISGAGNVIIDNGAANASWGTTAFTLPNTYTGTTTITKGRLVITTSSGLGSTSAGTTIGDLGSLSVGGSGKAVLGGLNITEPITIQRSVYSGGDYGNYPAAVIINNNGAAQTHTLSGPITIDSSDARIAVNTNTLVLPGGNIALGPNGANGVLSFTGDFAGVVQLQGSNPALATNGILILGGVEVRPESDAALGGPTAPITMRGGFFRPFVGMTNFGSHPINTADLAVGITVPAGQTFTIDQVITGGGAVGKRGDGTLSFVSSVTGTGQTYFDAGIVNVNSALTLDSLHLRSPVVNIGNGGVVTLKAGYNSFGQDSTGTNGGPDIATVNLTGNGQLVQTNGSDFNISDNPNTGATINVSDTATFTTGGITWLGKANGAVATLNQSGGTVNINRTGNFGFVIADGRGARTPTGYFNLSGGTFNAAGEVYVGEGGSNAVGGNRAHGNWTQTGGTANIANWFVIGRESAVGAFDMSGGVMNHTGGNMSLGDSNAGGEINTIKVHGNAVITNSGEMWVGTGGGTISDMKVYDTAQINTGNWFVVGRGGAKGTLDVYGNAVITKTGGNNSYVGESTTAVTSTMTVRDNAVFNATTGEFWVGQGGGVGILNLQDNASFSVNNWLALGRANGNSNGTINLSGSASLTKTGGGFLAIGSGGTGTFNMTGGTLKSNGTRLGEASNGTMSITGGSATFTGEFSIGYQGNLQGTLNVGGTANVTVPAVIYGVTGSGTSGGSINLSGGATLTGTSFTVGANSTGARTFKFDGGTLIPSADSTNFIGAKVTSVVSTHGANINTNGKSITVNSALTHDSGLGGADGGLTKTGAGTLKVTGTNTYTGNTTVSAGTLHATKPAALPGYANPAQVSVASGATLAVNAGGAGEWAVSDIATARASATFSAGSALAIDTTNAAAPVDYDQVLPGDVGLTKLGSGTLKLSAANTYTGPTVLSGTGTVVLGSAAWTPVLTNAGGAVVNGDKLVFDYTGTTSPVGTVAALLKSSHDSSNFRDPAQRIRTTNAADATHGLGYYDDGAASLTVKYTWYGDANLDGKINADDYALADRGLAKGLTDWVNGDFDYSGVIDSADYLLIDTSYGLSGGSLSPDFLAQREAQFGEAYVSQLIAAVPEPASLGLIGLGAVAALGRRRRNG